MSLPTLTLWQPWASLIAEGVKTIETRSWRAPDSLIGERIGVHAAAKRPEDNWPDLPFPPWTMWVDEFGDRWLQHYADGTFTGEYQVWPMPLGAVVATARLVACVPMVGYCGDHDGPALFPYEDGPTWLYDPDPLPGGTRMVDVSDQVPFGDFAVGRWGWILEDVEKLPEPIPAKGRQRVWWWRP